MHRFSLDAIDPPAALGRCVSLTFYDDHLHGEVAQPESWRQFFERVSLNAPSLREQKMADFEQIEHDGNITEADCRQVKPDPFEELCKTAWPFPKSEDAASTITIWQLDLNGDWQCGEPIDFIRALALCGT